MSKYNKHGDNEIVVTNGALPSIIDNTIPSIGEILNSFNLPRDIIASNEEIQYAWNELPREISRIPIELRDGLIARMCVATSVGLFDGAINYIWNAVILNLRLRIQSFGLGYVSQVLNKKFEDDDLYDLMDSELIDLCHKLELLSEDGFFFLNQCRDVRNNFSAAHPNIAQIDDRELINFVSRCCKYGISSDYALQGIRIADFVDAIKTGKFIQATLDMWSTSIENTFPAQRVLLIPMLHGLYCDSNSNEETRINSFQLCERISALNLLDSKVKSSLIDQHNKYLMKNDENKIKASRLFFQKLGLLDLLTETERHSIIRDAALNLVRVHQAYDNFYNEPPFALNLRNITNNTGVPRSVQEEFVQAVVTCYVGNPYGVSNAAIPYYDEMIENFSPREISLMFEIPNSRIIAADRIKSYPQCRLRFLKAMELPDKDSFTPEMSAKYKNLQKKFAR
jgi:hypothetical protein